MQRLLFLNANEKEWRSEWPRMMAFGVICGHSDLHPVWIRVTDHNYFFISCAGPGGSLPRTSECHLHADDEPATGQGKLVLQEGGVLAGLLVGEIHAFEEEIAGGLGDFELVVQRGVDE